MISSHRNTAQQDAFKLRSHSFSSSQRSLKDTAEKTVNNDGIQLCTLVWRAKREITEVESKKVLYTHNQSCRQQFTIKDPLKAFSPLMFYCQMMLLPRGLETHQSQYANEPIRLSQASKKAHYTEDYCCWGGFGLFTLFVVCLLCFVLLMFLVALCYLSVRLILCLSISVILHVRLTAREAQIRVDWYQHLNTRIQHAIIHCRRQLFQTAERGTLKLRATQ